MTPEERLRAAAEEMEQATQALDLAQRRSLASQAAFRRAEEDTGLCFAGGGEVVTWEARDAMVDAALAKHLGISKERAAEVAKAWGAYGHQKDFEDERDQGREE